MPVTEYIWDEDNDSLLMETDDDGNPTAIYTNTPDPYGELVSQHRDGQTYFHHYDGEANTRQVTDENQNVVEQATFTAFGEIVEKTSSIVNPFGYKGALGYYTNGEANDIYVRARLLWPTIARWMSQDPWMLKWNQETHAYSYARSNPVNLFDPSGKVTITNPRAEGWFLFPRLGIPGQTRFCVTTRVNCVICCEPPSEPFTIWIIVFPLPWRPVDADVVIETAILLQRPDAGVAGHERMHADHMAFKINQQRANLIALVEQILKANEGCRFPSEADCKVTIRTQVNQAILALINGWGGHRGDPHIPDEEQPMLPEERGRYPDNARGLQPLGPLPPNNDPDRECMQPRLR